jgi:hypothetical protein
MPSARDMLLNAQTIQRQLTGGNSTWHVAFLRKPGQAIYIHAY